LAFQVFLYQKVPHNTPFVDLFVPGEKAIYDMLNVTFLIDEEMKSWIEIHDWIRAMTFPTEYEEYQRLGQLNKNVRSKSYGYTTIFGRYNHIVVFFKYAIL